MKHSFRFKQVLTGVVAHAVFIIKTHPVEDKSARHPVSLQPVDLTITLLRLLVIATHYYPTRTSFHKEIRVPVNTKSRTAVNNNGKQRLHFQLFQ